MKNAALLLVLCALLAGSVPVLADGMFYWPEPVPPEIPYQRALLVYDGSYETLIVQSKYRMSSSSSSEFGWVVPVPSVPEMVSVEPDLAEMLFQGLAQEAHPEVTEISDWLWGPPVILCLLVGLASLVLLLLCGVSFRTQRLQFIRRRRRKVVRASLFFLVVSTVSFFALTWLLRSPARLGGISVEVLVEEQVGIYNAQVVRAGEAGDLIQWLNENRFQFDEQDTTVFDDYLRRGWFFVVARVDPARGGDEIVGEGLVAPLILRFETGAPVYPLALTATAGHDTLVLLYVLGDNIWQTDGRLELEYADETWPSDYLEEVCREALPDLAGEAPPSPLEEVCREASLEYLFPAYRAGAALPYLCRFKGTLTPAEMASDLVLAPAEDDEPYRKHIIQW